MMIGDTVSALSVLKRDTLRNRALSSFLAFIEKLLGVSITYDLRQRPYLTPELKEVWETAGILRRAGVLKPHILPATHPPDEPPMKIWTATCNDSTSHRVGGASPESDAHALMATLAEGLERYIWYSQTDHFISPIFRHVREMKGAHISPARFAGYSEAQRTAMKRAPLLDASYLWIKGQSLVSGTWIYLPAQVASGRGTPAQSEEPYIRQRTTIGLATWTTKPGAQLRGALEVIERDAYMIMWLNQLTLPRLNISEIAKQSDSLQRLLARFKRYGLKTYAIRMLTDAPTYAICVVIEDERGAPRFTYGLKAHRSLPEAIESALTEALRARMIYRLDLPARGDWDPRVPIQKIGHVDRVFYWALPENAAHLEFLIAGDEVATEKAAWEDDTDEEHLARIIRWCTTTGYECVSVPLTKSKRNPTEFHIELTVLPELQPTYLLESARAFGGERLKKIPEQFGYDARTEPFTSRPHPFF